MYRNDSHSRRIVNDHRGWREWSIEKFIGEWWTRDIISGTGSLTHLQLGRVPGVHFGCLVSFYLSRSSNAPVFISPRSMSLPLWKDGLHWSSRFRGSRSADPRERTSLRAESSTWRGVHDSPRWRTREREEKRRYLGRWMATLNKKVVNWTDIVKTEKPDGMKNGF